MKYKVLLVNGSPHEDGNTAHALRIVEDELKKHEIDTEWIHIGNSSVQGCIACERCAETNRCIFNEDCCNEIIDGIINADGVIFGSPVYFGGPNGALCTIMDRVFYAASDKGQHFSGKPVASIVTCWRAGGTAAIQRLNQYYTEGEMLVVSSKYWNMNFEENDAFGAENLIRLGEVFARTISR